MPTVFYTPVDDNVKKALDARKNFYGAMQRNSFAHTWLHQKMAWAEAKAFVIHMESDSEGIFTQLEANGGDVEKLDVTVKSVLKLSTTGGFAKRTGGERTSAGLYNSEQSDSDVGRWSVKPHLNKVVISHDGDWGSTKKAEVQFSVYNRADLSKQIAFLTIGAYVEISYGWSTNTTAEGSIGKYKGLVTNFNYNVNEYGGFDCTTYLIGPGFSIFSSRADGSIPTDLKLTDANSGEVYASTLVGLLAHLVQTTSTLPSVLYTSNVYRGIGLIQPLTTEPPPEASKTGTAYSFVKNYYISLERLVSVVNYIFLKAANKDADIDPFSVDPINKPVACNIIHTRVAPITNTKDFVSANPLECIFPGFYSYATPKLPDDSLSIATANTINKSYRFSAYYEDLMKKGDASKIMISIDWIIDLINDWSDSKNNADRNFSDFFEYVLSMIYQNSGERWSLAVVQDPKDPYQFYISDINYVDSEVTPYVITAVIKEGISRTSSVQGKVPSDLAAAAQIASITALTADARGLSKIYQNITNNNTSEINAYYSGSVEYNKLLNTLNVAKSNVIGQEVSIESVNNLRAALKAVYRSDQPGQDMNQIRIPFALDFTFTLDGIEGIVFGNAVTSNYLPEAYSGTGTSFTVTKVVHTIADNDWTTTCNTVCRIQL